MRVGALEKYSDNEFPGKIAAVIYLVGCNLRCPYCFKPELLGCGPCTQVIDEAVVFRHLERNLERLDGVVFSGGEPTLNEDLADWMRRVRALGLAIKLDTNGTQPECIRMLLAEGLLDYIAMDVKAPLENYAQIVGKRTNVEDIRTSIWLVKHSGIAHEFRTTVVPGLHTLRELKAIAELVHGAERYVVQDFVSTRTLRPDLQGRPSFSRKPLEDLRPYVERRVRSYQVRRSTDAREMPLLSRRRPAPPPVSLAAL
jgi:pyruvate formate lyase activating enzyme